MVKEVILKHFMTLAGAEAIARQHNLPAKTTFKKFKFKHLQCLLRKILLVNLSFGKLIKIKVILFLIHELFR